MSVHITNNCTYPVPIRLILISHSRLKWKIRYGQTTGSPKVEEIVVSLFNNDFKCEVASLYVKEEKVS